MTLERLAFIGVRGHYDGVLRFLPRRPRVRVVGLSDGGGDPIDPLTRWCDTNGHSPVVFDDYRRMLDSTAPNAVVVCGPFDQHAEMTIEAVRRGIHVLVEKTASISLADLKRLEAVHLAHPQVHMAAMHTSRFVQGFYTAWRLVQDGAIGDVRLINARKSYRIGQRGAFYHRRSTYGGTIPWVGAHAIDWVLWMSGHRIRSVHAVHSAVCNNGLGTMERSALCQFTLCGDRFASVSIDMFRPIRAKTHGDDWVRLVGTQGVLEATPDRVTLINDDFDGTTPMPMRNPPSMFHDFMNHVEGVAETINRTSDLFATTAACLLARQSADEGRPISASEWTGSPIKTVKPPIATDRIAVNA